MRKLFNTTVCLTMLAGVMTFLITTEAAQNSFWAEIAQGNAAEIAAGNLGVQRAQSEAVKSFAQQMVTEHTATGTELQTLAASKNVTLPTGMTAKQQSEMDKLGAKSGADFDRDFMKMMVKDHERMAKLLEREAERNADADVKAFAARTLTAVQGHLASAKTINDGLRGTTSNGNRGMSNSNRSSNSNRGSNSNSNSNSNRSNNNNSNNN